MKIKLFKAERFVLFEVVDASERTKHRCLWKQSHQAPLCTTTGTDDALVHRSPGEDLKLKPEKKRGLALVGCVQQAGQAGHRHSHQIKGKKALTYLEAKEDDWCHSRENNGCCCRKAFHDVICVLNNHRGVEATHAGQNWKQKRCYHKYRCSRLLLKWCILLH